MILNQTLYNVYLFKNNSYFYHDLQVDAFDEVKGVEPNWLYVKYCFSTFVFENCQSFTIKKLAELSMFSFNLAYSILVGGS